MAITSEIMNRMVLNLREERIENGFYEEIENVLNVVMRDVITNNIILNSKLSFFMVGDHILNTNLLNTSPLVIFFSLKQNKEELINYKKSLTLSKRAQELLNLAPIITDNITAELLFNSLQNHLSQNDKLFRDKNIIMVNLANAFKLKIIVGYNFDGIFEYEYFGNHYTENFLALIEALDKKNEQTKNYFDMVRILKSMELAMLETGYVKDKSYDVLHFVENLVYNVPNELLTSENFYDAFLKTLNYLKNADLTTFKLASNDEPMFNGTENSIYTVLKAKHFIKVIDYFYVNFDKVS